MKKQLKKKIIGFLLLSILLSNMSLSYVLAEDHLNHDEMSSEQELLMLDENIIDFVYIESPYLKAPGTQRIVFSFSDQIGDDDTVSLIVTDEHGGEEEWKLSERSEMLYLFEKDFNEGTPAEVYKVAEIVFKNDLNKTEKRISLENSSLEAQFGVNEEYQGLEELIPVDNVSSTESRTAATDSEALEISVVSLDEVDEKCTSEAITEAMDHTADIQDEMPQVYSNQEAEQNTRSQDIVVALDPGHDARDAGASGYGLREEELTLKIANYCKEELEQYPGIQVYMTRTTAACPYNKPGITCMRDRVKAAAKAGAKYFISFHLNSSVASGANGAEIIIPNPSWKSQLHTNGKQLAEKILKELVQLGLSERSIYYKNTTANEKYPDGSMSDYFSVQIYCKENNLAGLIVEHAFLSNANDVNRFLKTEAGLKKLGVADATGIAKYFGLSKGKWEFVEGIGWKYRTANGYVVDDWKVIGGKKYHFDKNGVMQTGWQTIEGKRYFFNNSGDMKTGWLLNNGIWYYLNSNGQMTTGWQWVNGWYYMNSKGEMQTGWLTLGNSKYYLNAYGTMLTGWQTIEGNKYYFDGSGCMKTGIQTIGGEKYEFANDGKLIGKIHSAGWSFEQGKWYYYNSKGKRLTGWQWINGWYYMNSKGEMQTGWKHIEGKWYYLNGNGIMQTGWQYLNGKWYYLNSSGVMQTGWLSLWSSKFYLGTSGEAYIGLHVIDGYEYYFDNNGYMKTGIQTINGVKYEFASDGKLIRKLFSPGWHFEQGKWYYYNKDGRPETGWKFTGGKWYYLNSKGVMLTGWQFIGGKWYYLNGSGAMQTGWQYLGGSWYYLNGSGAMLTGTQTIGGRVYTFASDGRWY